MIADLVRIRFEIDRDLYKHKICESCEGSISEYLYVVQNLLFGIFHICEECKQGINESDTPEFKSIFLKKFQAICWEDFEEEEVLKDTPLR